MHILTKRGNLDNVITYEHICDTTEDMAFIERKYITLGSTCVVLSGDSGGMEVYMADSNKEWHDIMMSGNETTTAGLELHVCTAAEVQNGKPNIDTPLESTLYLVPSGAESGNLYDEYVYVNEQWELFGGARVNMSGYATESWVQQQNYLTRVPHATETDYGTIKLGAGLAQLVDAQGNDEGIGVLLAPNSIIKQGTETSWAVPVSGAGAAAFYGLAKAAGDTTQAQSSNAVGTYTAAAKTAIQGMLGVVTVDTTLSNQGKAADAKAAGDALATKLTKPATDGTNGQVLMTDGQGGASWADALDSTAVESAVGSYINAHPEVIAVADGSITEAKLSDSLNNKIGEIYDSVINENTFSAGVLEQGSLSDSAGTESSSTNTVRSGFVSPDALTIKMVVKDGWKVKTPYYATPSSFTATTAYKTGTDVIELNDTDKKLFRIAIRKVDNTDITPADVPEDVVTLSYNTNTVTEMADDVAGVKDTFVDDSAVEEVIYGGRYNQGTLNETTGANISSNYFIRTSRLDIMQYYNPLYPILHIEPTEGYVLGIFIYHFVDGTRTFAYGINGIDAPYDYEMKEPIDLRIAVSKADGSTISNYQENTQNLFALTFKRNKTDIANFETENFLKNEQFVRIVNSSSCLYHCNNIVSGNGYIDPATGEAQVFSTANKLSTTKMIDISKYGVLYYKKAGYTNNPGGMAFYDADGTYISGEPAIKGTEQYNIKVLHDVTYEILGVVKVPKNAVYARFTILTGESKGEFHLYGTYRHMSEYNDSKYGITTKRNSQEKVTEFLNIAKTYLPTGNSYLPEGHSGQDTLGYGYGTILSSATPDQTVTDKWDIDCSTFVGLALRGYTYEETSYPTQNWVDPSTWVANPNVEWAINPFDWIYPVNADWVMEAEDVRAYGRVRTAAAMCQWMVERGWEVPIDPKLANLEPGDIIFYSRHNSADNDYIDPERYKLINHVAICMSKEAPPSSNWDPEKYPYRHRLIDVRTRTGACGTDVVETAWNDPTAIYSNNVNTIACICRPDFR